MQLVPSSWLESDEILRRVLKIDDKTFLKGKGSTSIKGEGQDIEIGNAARQRCRPAVVGCFD